MMNRHSHMSVHPCMSLVMGVHPRVVTKAVPGAITSAVTSKVSSKVTSGVTRAGITTRAVNPPVELNPWVITMQPHLVNPWVVPLPV